MLGEAVRQLGDGRVVPGGVAAGVTPQQQVVGDRDPVAGLHRQDLVAEVGVKRDKRMRGLRSLVGSPLFVMPDEQGAPGVRGRQRHDQGPDHRVVLLGILVRDEELALLVHEHRVHVDVHRALPWQL